MKGLKPQDMGFMTGEVAALLKVSPRRVEGWVEQGFIKPAVRGKGPGRRNLFSKEQVILGAVILEIQASFGEKSALVGRLFPGVSQTLLRLARADEAIFLGVSLKAGEVVHVTLGMQRQQALFLHAMTDLAHTVAFINVSAILHKLFEDVKV
jgi:helix-turn-helix protein